MSGTGMAHGIRLRHVMGNCRRRAVCRGFIRDSRRTHVQITRAILISHPPIGSVDAPLFPVPYVQAVEFTLEANPNLTSSNAHKNIKRHLSVVYHATV